MRNESKSIVLYHLASSFLFYEGTKSKYISSCLFLTIQKHILDNIHKIVRNEKKEEEEGNLQALTVF